MRHQISLPLFLAFLILTSKTNAMASKEDVIRRLQNPFHVSLYQNTYQSLLKRLGNDGYLPESLTGAYYGMFPRTVGPYVFLLLEEGEWEKAKRVLKYTLEATALAQMNRIPHVIGPSYWEEEPIVKEGEGQLLHLIALYRLDMPDYGGAQPFKAIQPKLYGVEMWLTSEEGEGELLVEIVRSIEDRSPMGLVKVPIGKSTGGWVKARFEEPLHLEKGRDYLLRLRFQGKGKIIWWGLNEVTENPFGGAFSYDKPPIGWQRHSDHVTAFALDFGALRHRREKVIPILCRADQPDGHYHVILAWARYVESTKDKEFEDSTYGLVARLTDLCTDMPYLNIGWGTTATYLVRNPCFEHSREVRFWDCYDLLTQVFTAEAWREMLPIAKRRGDWEHYWRWQRALSMVERGIREFLTRQINGKTIYAEMRLPDGGKGTIYEGLSWVNLSPIAAGWKGADRAILDNTIAIYRKYATFQWENFNLLGAEWDPPNKIARSVIGKQWAWEFLYSVEKGEWDRACELLDFLERANTNPIFAECFWLSPEGKMMLNDPGNGEQTSWYCWAIAKARRILGISSERR